MRYDQAGFMRKFNETHREQFNPKLFERDNQDIVNAIYNVLKSCEKDRYFTLKLLDFEVIEDYEKIFDKLREHEEGRKKKNDKTAVRFVSTIDNCLDYTSVGFKFTGDYGAKHIDTEKTCTKVYKNINADGQTLTPSTAFDNTDSAYFFTYSVRNMDGTTSSTWTVTPFYVTPDGTKVYGTTKDYSM